VPIDPRQLRRGRICLAVFPFAPAFPVELADASRVNTVDEWAHTHKGKPVKLVSEARLRPILLLHDRTRPEHGDAVCVRVNTARQEIRRDPEVWRRIEAHEHPSFFHLPKAIDRYKLREDSIIAISSLGAVHRSAILAPTGGELSPHEMQIISERLAALIELDLAPKIATLARELLARGGYVRRTSTE